MSSKVFWQALTLHSVNFQGGYVTSPSVIPKLPGQGDWLSEGQTRTVGKHKSLTCWYDEPDRFPQRKCTKAHTVHNPDELEAASVLWNGKHGEHTHAHA